MSITTRRFTGSDADFALKTTLWNKAWPEYYRTEKIHRHDEETRNKEYYFIELIIEQDGTPIGMGEYMDDWDTDIDDDYFFMLYIDPDADFQAAANAFMDAMNADIASRGGKTSGTIMLENHEDRCQLLKDHGYTPAMREPRSELDVTSFDFSRYDWVDAKMADEKIEIVGLAEVKSRFADWQQRSYDLDWPIVSDIPTTVELKRQPFEEFIKHFSHPNHLVDGGYYAIDGDQLVGLSVVKAVDGNPEQLSVGITGVLPSHRRRGIATALKLETIKFARRYGAKIIKTDNEENNPMYDLNVQLGFKPKPALLIFEKNLQPQTTSEEA